MARNKSGGGVDDYLADATGTRLAGEKVGFYREAACTTRITDLLDDSGTPVTELTTDADGYWGIVQFPDDGTTYAYAARLHPSNGAPITPGRIVDAHTAFLNFSGEKGSADGIATLDGSGNVVEPVPYGNVTGVPDLSVYAQKAEVPSLEEIAAPFSLHWTGQTESITRDASDTAARSVAALCLPFDWYLHSVEFLWNIDIAASDTDYWTIELRRWDGALASGNLIAAKTTKATGGEAIVRQKPWRLNTGALDAGFRKFGPDHALRIETLPTDPGLTLPDLAGPSTAVIRYARQ